MPFTEGYRALTTNNSPYTSRATDVLSSDEVLAASSLEVIKRKWLQQQSEHPQHTLGSSSNSH